MSLPCSLGAGRDAEFIHLVEILQITPIHSHAQSDFHIISKR